MGDTPKLGDRVRLEEGPHGQIVGRTENLGFPAYEIQLSQGEIVTEARYRFSLVVNTSPTSEPQRIQSPCSTITTTRPGRFRDVVDRDIEEFITRGESKLTVKKTEGDIRTLTEFLSFSGETRAPETIPPEELSRLLSKFFMVVKKQDGEDYEPSSLRGILCSIDRYLRRKNYGISIINGDEFAQVREVMKSRQILLKRDGKGNKSHRSEPLTDNDVDKLFETGQMGTNNPEALLRAVWFFNTVHFGLRGVTEHRDMQWGDVKLAIDSEGVEYLQYSERNTKTRTGANPRDVRPITPRAWVNLDNPQRCPILHYKAYRSKRPAHACNDDSPFYIATNTQPAKSGKWFKAQAVGVNKLGKFMSTMAKNSGLTQKGMSEKRLTNHSARKYLIQKLSDQGVPPTQIMQISGHRNLQSVNSYSTLNPAQQRSISCLLSQSSSRETTTTYRSILPAATVTRPSREMALPPAPSPRRSQPPAIDSRTSEDPTIVNVTHPESATSPVNHAIFAGPIYGGTFTINVCQHRSNHTS